MAVDENRLFFAENKILFLKVTLNFKSHVIDNVLIFIVLPQYQVEFYLLSFLA